MKGSFLAVSKDGHHKQRKQSVSMYNWDLPKESILYYLLFMNCFKKGFKAAILTLESVVSKGSNFGLFN